MTFEGFDLNPAVRFLGGKAADQRGDLARVAGEAAAAEVVAGGLAVRAAAYPCNGRDNRMLAMSRRAVTMMAIESGVWICSC